MRFGSENSEPLRHGFTLGDLHVVAQAAARTAGPAASDYADRFDTAWSAIVEHLYSTDEAPTAHDLVGVGCNAIWRAMRATMHCHGLVPAKDGGNVTMQAFERFWRWHAPIVPPPEDRVVERLAARQIFRRLTGLQREALTAYAAGNSLSRGALALAVPEKTFSARVDYGRRAFLALWHEGETPSRKWRKEGARRPDARLVPCGSDSAYFRHRRRGEPIDEACAAAHAAVCAASKRRRKGLAA